MVKIKVVWCAIAEGMFGGLPNYLHNDLAIWSTKDPWKAKRFNSKEEAIDFLEKNGGVDGWEIYRNVFYT